MASLAGRLALVLLVLALQACGGDASASRLPVGAAGADPASEFIGTFVSPCESADEVVVAESGNPVSVRTYRTIAQPAGNTASISLRFDFHLDAACGTSPVAHLSMVDPANQVRFEGAVGTDGKTAQRVRVTLAATSAGTSTHDGRFVFGDAIPLSAPESLLRAVAFRDLWLLEGESLYEGALATGADGYPARLELSAASERVESVPPVVTACAAASVTWGEESCRGSVPAAASGTSLLLADITAPHVGSATFTCRAGSWAPTQATCGPEVAPVHDGCAASSVVWVVNGNACEGELETAPEGSRRTVLASGPASNGMAEFICTAGTQVATRGTCAAQPPLPPVLTDAAQIVLARNCIVCHAVADAEHSVGGVSLQRIAERYRGALDPAGLLAARVKAGTVGSFGPVPMPPNPQISDAELALVIPWVLSR